MNRHRRNKKRWIQKAVKKSHRGMLHRHYRIPMGRKIPYRLLLRDQHLGGKLGMRVRFALNMRRAAARRAKRKHRRAR